MNSGPGSPSAEPTWWPGTLAALACGLYVSMFYVAANYSMLSPASMLLIAAIFTLPIVLAVLGSNLILSLVKLSRLAGFASAFLVGFYLLLALRTPIYNVPAVQDIRGQLNGGAWEIALVAFFLVLGGLFTFLFGRNLGRLAAILAVMTAAAALPALLSDAGDAARGNDPGFLDVKLDRRPDIHLILTDSFASFEYLRSQGIDVSGFETHLKDRGFRVYEDSYSNYHATTDSMLSMLEMQHHYYRWSLKQAEVTQSARQIIGGKNSLVRLLKNNGYRTQYIHQGAYLLFQGCTADYCYPSNHDTYTYAGARSVLKEILPRSIAKWMPAQGWESEKPPLSVMRREISVQLKAGRQSGTPQFQYVHMYDPFHPSNSLIGKCEEAVELTRYAGRVAAVMPEIESIVDEIIRGNPDAVIVLSGDHGPFISNRCAREIDIDTTAEYRDRVGVLNAVRWPQGYDGRFDARIRTNVNLFRYVLASLINGSDDALGGRLTDDVFVRGTRRVLKILEDGEPLVPPVEFSPKVSEGPDDAGP